jgi:hypothetical protein
MPRLAFVLLAGLLAAPVLAVPAPVDSDSDTITVTGERLTRPQLRARSLEFVRTALADTTHGQHARWQGSICPRVFGAQPATEALFLERFRTAADVLGVRTEAPGCQPNIVVWFTADARGLMRTISARSPNNLEDTSTADRRRLFNGDDPVRWFYSTKPEGSSGQTMGEGSAAIGAQLGTANTPVVNNRLTSSRLSTGTRVALTGATIIIDVPLAEGHSLEALAAQAVMLGFARTRLGKERPASTSILTLFSPRLPETRPRDLSPIDDAFLVALYKAPDDKEANWQRAFLVSAMVDDLFGERRDPR